jgi:hypothetical protein
MKKLLYAFLFLCSLNTFSQDLATLKTEAQKAIELTAKMDFNAILDITYPKLFTMAPREKLLEILDQTFNGNPDFKIKMIPVAPNFNFGAIKKIEGHTFCVVKHNNAMEMTFTNKIDNPNIYIDAIKTSMKADDVTYSAEKNSISIKLISTMIAVADESTKNKWMFLNNDNDGNLLKTLFSEKIKTELGL